MKAEKAVKDAKLAEPKTRVFVIDCSKPVEDKVFNTSNFAEYLRQRIKVKGKTGHLGDSVKVSN